MSDFSRRDFILTGSAALTSYWAKAEVTPTPLTAGEVVDRIRKQVGIPWRAQTVDQIVAGSESTPVRGIATTMMATLDVVERASAAGKNMIVTHETPFYLHQDHTEDIKDDSTLKYKLDFIRKNDMAIFHFHDHWHARQPDGIATGMMMQLGWEKNVDPENPKRFTFHGVQLAHFCKEMQAKLKDRTIRVDVFIAGETREWELVEYVRDSITAGNKKALILLGHVVSEQGGMTYCADWLRSFISEVPVEFVPTREPFWTPDHPVEI
jgi:putative NIF3 family GTP cyclohydrolase 1 type 2